MKLTAHRRTAERRAPSFGYWTKIVFAAAFGLAVGMNGASAQLPDRIKLGNIGSFTGALVEATLSPSIGLRMAVAEINKAGGIAGKQVDVVLGDDQSDPTAAVNEIIRLTKQEKVHAVMGPTSSQLTLAIQPILNEARVFNISNSGATSLTPQVGRWHFSLVPPADASGRAMVVYAAETLKVKTIAWIGDTGAQAKAALEAAKDEAKKRGLTVTGEQGFEIAGTDMTPQLLSLRRGNPEALLMWSSTGENHGNISKNLGEISWKVKLVGGLTPTFLTAAAKKISPDAFKDFASVGMRAVSYCSNDPVGQTLYPKFRDRLKAFEPQRYEKLAAQNAAWFYDGVYIMKAAIEATRSIDGPVLTKWVEENIAKVPNMVTGPYSASASNHFFFGSPSTLSMVENPDQPRSDGLLKRAGC